ncbi:MAG: hypothetical protein WD669_12605 [Pirellulales bacterium]
MGADSTLVFYGVRFSTNESESEALQGNTDERVRRAREHQLAHWWGSFSLDPVNEQMYLLIGAIIGHIGHEGAYELQVRDNEYQTIVAQTKTKLAAAGFKDEPALFIQFEPDY